MALSPSRGSKIRPPLTSEAASETGRRISSGSRGFWGVLKATEGAVLSTLTARRRQLRLPAKSTAHSDTELLPSWNGRAPVLESCQKRTRFGRKLRSARRQVVPVIRAQDWASPAAFRAVHCLRQPVPDRFRGR